MDHAAQLSLTRQWIARFEESLKLLSEPDPTADPILREAEKASAQSMIKTLRDDEKTHERALREASAARKDETK